MGRVRFLGPTGRVLEESAEVALSYLTAVAARLGIDGDELAGRNLEIQIRGAGDGLDTASLSLAILLGIASAVTRRAVPSRLAAVGEVTLRGLILPMGGVEELVLAAERAGMAAVLIPKDSEPELDGLLVAVRRRVKIVAVSRAEDALMVALPGLDWGKRRSVDGV
jgi:ATP-dependent Lon protease